MLRPIIAVLRFDDVPLDVKDSHKHWELISLIRTCERGEQRDLRWSSWTTPFLTIACVLLLYVSGNVYSVNDGRYFDWPPGLRHYVDSIRQGRGQNPRRYSAKYISSLVADLHRTILYGGIAMNPRAHLLLVHEANALSFLVENGGGRAIDGRRRILEIQPTHLHLRMPLFLGSRADVSELESYGDVQQVININREYDDDDGHYDD